MKTDYKEENEYLNKENEHLKKEILELKEEIGNLGLVIFGGIFGFFIGCCLFIK